MFNRLKSIFRSRTPPKQLVRARFDAAQTTRDNWRHWSAADHLSADMEAAPEVRRTLRMRSRYEVANNSYARGLVQMLANDTIGTGPRLQMLSADETFNDAVETAFMRWSDAVRLAPKLRTMRMARCQDGEAFAVLATNPKIRHGVKLDLQLIEADRVSGELRWFEDDTSVDGISYDSWGNPTDYRVLKYHPGDIRYMPGDDAIHIPLETGAQLLLFFLAHPPTGPGRKTGRWRQCQPLIGLRAFSVGHFHTPLADLAINKLRFSAGKPSFFSKLF